MSIRVVFFSDTHLGFDYPVRRSSASGQTRPRRGQDFFANFQRVLDHARTTKPDLLIHGGDFFFRSRVNASIVERAYQALFEFAEGGIPVAIVPGNHERSVLPPSLFLNHPNIFVFDRPRTFRFDIGAMSLSIAGFPYLKNVRSRFQDALKACEDGQPAADYRLLCLHHAVDGAVVGPAGFRFNGAADVIDRTQLPASIDAVLAGHIHRHQILSYQVPVVFCGSSERTSYAEQNETKGFCELTLARSSPLQVDFRALPTRPMVDFDGRDYSATSELLAAFERLATSWSANSMVRIRLNDYPDRQLAQALGDIVTGPLSYSCAVSSRVRQGLPSLG